MSRVWEGGGENPACLLWHATFLRAINSPRGQKLLRELEAAMLALPAPRLSAGAFAEAKREYETTGYTVSRNELIPTGEVCALGALALARRLAAGETRDVALRNIVERMRYDDEGSTVAADELNIARTVAWELINQNDDDACRDETPEARYVRMLAWVREHIRG